MAQFKVMTWNVENLFSVGHEFGPKTEEIYTKKLRTLAAAILQIDPHVVALQEIGDLQAFTDLIDLLDDRYSAQITASPDRRGIRVGFLSKLAIESHEEVSIFPAGGLVKVTGYTTEDSKTDITQLGRNALCILVQPTPNMSIHLLNAHLKSKLLTFSSNGRTRFQPKDENERAQVAGLALLRRTAEAVALRIKANQLLSNNANQGLILLGDLNDVPAAATTQILQGPSGSEIDTSGFDRPDRGDDTRLFNLAPRIPETRRYSRIYRNSKELIDHILVSQELLPERSRKLPAVDSYVDLAETLPSIEDDPGMRRNQPGSDHAPIVATFDL